MARTKPSESVYDHSPEFSLSSAAIPLLIRTGIVITAGVEKEFRHLLECTKNETAEEQSRQNFESAWEALSQQASKTTWQNSHQQANLMSFCAEIMSDVLSTNNIELIKLVFISLATWLVPESISKIASACQQYSWNAMKHT